MAKNLIDFDELLGRTENDKELMRDLLAIFKEEFPQRLQALRDAVASLNAPPGRSGGARFERDASNLAAVEAAALRPGLWLWTGLCQNWTGRASAAKSESARTILTFT